jgi:tetratricopeptide (TPR) repeat protein
LHLKDAFGIVAMVLAIAGFFVCWRWKRGLTLWIGAVFVITGPIFFFLANMPPNPHALAIVEASFLIPDVMAAAAIGLAITAAFAWRPWAGQACFALALISVAVNAPASFHRADKRDNYYARDFVSNVFRSLPTGAVAIFHKDVQLFSLWSAQLVEGRRPDVSLLSTGLSASPWFWAMHRRWGVAACPEISLKNDDGWRQMKAAIAPRPFLAGYDVEIPSNSGLMIAAHGYVAELTDRAPAFNANLARTFVAFGLNRGRGRYGETPDFFSTDLIGDAARALHQTGLSALGNSVPAAAAFYFGWSEAMDPTVPRPAADAGYLHFASGNFPAAQASYARALRKAEARLALARSYKSLPEVMNACLFDVASILVHIGATLEKMNEPERAREAYRRSIGVQETAQAHYNLAVTYWGRDWPVVISHMRRALELNPSMNEARIYGAKAMELSGKK